MPSPARVMVLALDAADPELVRELSRAGEMPTMARLLDEAAVVDLLGPPAVFVSANWPTVFTARQPDEHGYLCWDELRPGTYEYAETDPRRVRGTPVWERMSEAGRRVAILDVPHSIARPVNGVMVAEWGCHDRHFGPTSWPPELTDELTDRYGVHYGSMPDRRENGQFAPCDFLRRDGEHRTDEETAAFFADVCDGLERKRAMSLGVLDRGGWDFFLSVMAESHCMGHQLWHLHEIEHPRHDPDLARRIGGDPLRQVYRQLDEVVAEHLARLGPDDTAYVLFAHGMVAHHDGTHLLDHVLHRLDFGLDVPDGFGSATRLAAGAARWIPRPVRGRALRLAAPLVRAHASASVPAPLPPYPQRRWFKLPNNTVVGAVRLNLAGREPSGRVHPTDRRDALRWLAARLTELVNLDTGGPVVRECVITDDVYRPDPADGFADLYVEWERSAPIERVWSPAVGTLSVPYEHWREGDHVREGMVLATGPGIRGGRRRGARSTADLGATFAAAVGVSLPDVDGEPIDSILPGGGAGARPGRETMARGRAALARAARRRFGSQEPAWAHRRDPDITRIEQEMSSRVDAVAHTAQRVAAEAEGLAARVAQLEREAKVATMSSWLPHAEVAEDLLVSVVMPTRDRREFLEAAIASVQAQSYSRWELIVVDDGSADGTADYLGGLDDPRIRVLRTGGVGPCAARNAALDGAGGDVITYLDDDNRFDPQWLKAVVSTFLGLPETAVCYGARICDDEGRVLHGATSGRPWMAFVGWDAVAIRDFNLADTNVLAHRRNGVRFDEALVYLGDWDLLLRLTHEAEPVEVPAIAAYYRTDVEGRISTSLAPEEIDREYARVRSKLGAGGR